MGFFVPPVGHDWLWDSFPNATCGEALQHFPPTKVNDTFAVSFLTISANEKSSQSELASHARQVVSKIAKFKVTKSLFDEQAAALKTTNIVYQEAIYDEQLLSSWVPDPAVDTVPPPILDAVVAIEAVKDPGRVVASGPADATVDGEQDRLDADVDAAKQARYISAFEPQVADLNERSSATSEVVALLNQLEDLDAATQRSVASEVESAIEGGACLTDDVGRTRILNICHEVREKCERLAPSEKQQKLEKEMQQAALGTATWQKKVDGNGIPLLQVPRGKVPLSLWDWKVWSQARPALWRYGDCCNFYKDHLGEGRLTHLLTVEWMQCLLCREEMVYSLPTDTEEFVANGLTDGGAINRFADDWVTLHLMSTLYQLSENSKSTYAFLKNGGMTWARKVKDLSAETLASAARLTGGDGGLQGIMQSKKVPQIIRDALNAMQVATADVVGTDGHRRLCRHE